MSLPILVNHGSSVPPNALVFIAAASIPSLWAAAEFDRVANAFEKVASAQQGRKQVETKAIIAIVPARQADVLAREDAGYFIQEWQELSDQVRRLIAAHRDYQAIKAGREAQNR